MSRILTSIGINAYQVLSSRRTGDLHEVEVALRKKPSACLRSPCKGARLQSKGRYRRTVRHLDSMGAATRLIIHARRFRCLSCRRSFVEPLPGILPGKHSSEPFRQHVYTLHHEGIPNSNTGRITRIAPATVGRIFSEFTLKKAKERISSQCPRVLGIDEHTLHKKTRFASTLCDLANHRVFDLFEGKSAASLHDAFTQLSGRDRVRVVCIDLSVAYRSIVRTFFPNALVVADRFHVIRVVQHHFLQFARQIAPTLDGRRGHLGLFRKKPDTLQPAQSARLQALFLKFPPLVAVYEKMHAVHRLFSFKHQTKRRCKRLIACFLKLIADLKHSQIPSMLTLAATLEQWQEEIVRMWRFTKNNGITEGFHRKMKLIQRRAYGFRNFQNYRLRVLAACG